MKAKDWEFDKFIPDVEDTEAKLKAMDAWFGLKGEQCRADCFCAGFNRGVQWAQDKQIPDKPDVMYAIGQDHGEGQYGMWDGPNPSLDAMLEVVGHTNASVIVRFNEDGTTDVLYRWDGDDWKRV